MWKKLSLYVCLITILCSCQKQRSAYAPPTFPEVKKIHAHRLSDELLISYPLDMAVSEDYIFILALADNLKAWARIPILVRWNGGYYPLISAFLPMCLMVISMITIPGMLHTGPMSKSTR